MTNSEIGGHLGRHLEFLKRLRVDSWGLLAYAVGDSFLNIFSLL